MDDDEMSGGAHDDTVVVSDDAFGGSDMDPAVADDAVGEAAVSDRADGGVTADAGLTGLLHAQMPFTALLGLEAVRASPDEVVARAHWSAERCTVGGMLHGGYLVALADSVGAACAVFNLSDDSGGTTTVESSTRFIRAVREGTVTITATPLHVGRSTIVIQTDITREDGALVTRTTQTQAVLPAG